MLWTCCSHWTDQLSWVELSWVGRCDHSKNPTQLNWTKIASFRSVAKFWTCCEHVVVTKLASCVELSRVESGCQGAMWSRPYTTVARWHRTHIPRSEQHIREVHHIMNLKIVQNTRTGRQSCVKRANWTCFDLLWSCCTTTGVWAKTSEPVVDKTLDMLLCKQSIVPFVREAFHFLLGWLRSFFKFLSAISRQIIKPEQGERSPLTSPFFPFFPYLPLSFPPSPPLSYLRSRPQKSSYEVYGSAVSPPPTGVWGDKRFGAFFP